MSESFASVSVQSLRGGGAQLPAPTDGSTVDLGGSAVHIDGTESFLRTGTGADAKKSGDASPVAAVDSDAGAGAGAGAPLESSMHRSDSGDSLGSSKTNPQGARRKRKSPSSYDTLVAGQERLVSRLRPAKAHAQLDTVSTTTAVRVMAERRLDAILLINTEGSLSGILTDRDINDRVVAQGLNPDEVPVSSVMTPDPSCVTPNTSAMAALRTMVDRHFRHLPVAAGGKVEALLDITKCLYHAISKIEAAYERHGQRFSHTIGKLERELGIANGADAGQLFEDMRKRLFLPTLKDLPSVKAARTVPWVSAMATTRQAAELMFEQHVSAVVVIDESDDIIGIFTTKDIMQRVVAKGLDPATTQVTHVMTLYPECVTLDTTILDALHLMHDGRFLHLPIVGDVGEAGCVVGLVDVLELTYGVVSQMGSVQATAAGENQAPIWQNFWASLLSLDDESDDDRASTASVASSAALTFAFKFSDAHGRNHRFTAACDSLQQLRAIVAERIGEESACIVLNFVDDEGEECLMLCDSDLRDAIDAAHSRGISHLPLVVSVRAFVDGCGIDGEVERAETETPRPSSGASSDIARDVEGMPLDSQPEASEALRERVRVLERILARKREAEAEAGAKRSGSNVGTGTGGRKDPRRTHGSSRPFMPATTMIAIGGAILGAAYLLRRYYAPDTNSEADVAITVHAAEGGKRSR